MVPLITICIIRELDHRGTTSGGTTSRATTSRATMPLTVDQMMKFNTWIIPPFTTFALF
ncbi:MAG: hypothetical protein IPP15_20985 [Saprospiraceae bacterium]|uniref:Uncharacterized protein n=1 Tax=Candidatus Opimibacter skivensis TaxID=2982028 RepID=A0A9D7XR58_9BACT|nr:hypothetical protein [Candidatus Opimibacter skivensis]